MAKSIKIKKIYKDGKIKFEPCKKYDSYSDKFDTIINMFLDARLMMLSDNTLRQIDIYDDTKLIATVYG